MACCWDMEESDNNTSVNSGDDHEPCHKAADSKEKDTEENKQGPNDCCYDMVECQLQLIKITKAVTECIESQRPFDQEFRFITTKGR